MVVSLNLTGQPCDREETMTEREAKSTCQQQSFCPRHRKRAPYSPINQSPSFPMLQLCSRHLCGLTGSINFEWGGVSRSRPLRAITCHTKYPTVPESKAIFQVSIYLLIYFCLSLQALHLPLLWQIHLPISLVQYPSSGSNGKSISWFVKNEQIVLYSFGLLHTCTVILTVLNSCHPKYNKIQICILKIIIHCLAKKKNSQQI